MKNYLAIYTGAPDSMEKWKALDADTRARRERDGMAGWQAWVEKNKDAIVDNGSPLGKTKRVTSAGIADIRNQMAAWTVVRADSHEAAARIFEGHPHFMIFPGDGIEVMECLPIPGQG
jgi:leucyl aminopeptidase (aminopeptidase T)